MFSVWHLKPVQIFLPLWNGPILKQNATIRPGTSMEKSRRTLTGLSALGHGACSELLSGVRFAAPSPYPISPSPLNTPLHPSVRVVDWELFYYCNIFSIFMI